MRKFLIFIIIFFLVSLVFVRPTQANVLDTTKSFTSCAGAGFLTNYIKDGISGLKKSLGSLLSGIGGMVPVVDEKFIDKYTNKEGAQDIIARCTAREILAKLGKDVDKIARTSGRDGGPAYVRNWRNFQTDAQYRGEAIFRNVLASTPVCNYFKGNIQKIFNVKGKKDLGKTNTRINSFDPFQLEAGCTLPAGFDIEDYKEDFVGNGGWNAWSRLLEPQNNFYGVLFKSLDEAAKQRALEEEADKNEAISGFGLTSIRGKNANDSCAVRGFNGQCIVYKDIKTPANFIAGGVNARTQAEFDWITGSDELNEIIASALQVLVNRLFDFSNANEGKYIVPGKISIDDSVFPSGEGGGVCPVPTTPKSLCEGITEDAVMGVIRGTGEELVTEGLTDGMIAAVESAFPNADFLEHRNRDKFDFGGGMIVDVVNCAGGTLEIDGCVPSFGWNVDCACTGPLGGGGGGGNTRDAQAAIETLKQNLTSFIVLPDGGPISKATMVAIIQQTRDRLSRLESTNELTSVLDGLTEFESLLIADAPELIIRAGAESLLTKIDTLKSSLN